MRKDDRPSDSEEESNFARLQINKGGDDADLNKEDVQDHGVVRSAEVSCLPRRTLRGISSRLVTQERPSDCQATSVFKH